MGKEFVVLARQGNRASTSLMPEDVPDGHVEPDERRSPHLGGGASMTWRWFSLRIVVASVASVALVGPAPQASAAAADGTVSVTPELWPNLDDGGPSTTATITVEVREAGLFNVWISSRGDFVDWEAGEGWLDVGTHVFTWDGRGEPGGLPVNRGTYRAHLLTSLSDGGWVEEDLASFKVLNSTEVVRERDRNRERGVGLVDMNSFSLSNGPREVEVSFGFRDTNRRNLTYATAALDVDRDPRGYLLTVQRKKGRLVPSLTLAILASDDPYNKRVKCPRLAQELTRGQLVLTVPRSCLRIGGRKMRANYWIGGRDNRTDYGPDSGAYCTDFTTYTLR